MKTVLGGDRLGSGNKQNISMRNYERSTHDLGYSWRSSMAAGTLVPFMNFVALPGDTFDIDLDCDVLTLPTIGPLFGSFKVQLDVFCTPYRLYNASLHMNRLGIGNDMSQVLLPQWQLRKYVDFSEPLEVGDNDQINPSSLAKYLGISGLGTPNVSNDTTISREFNAVPLLAYWDIYKNYYANKQEDRGFGIHIDESTINARQTTLAAELFNETTVTGQILDAQLATGTGNIAVVVQFGEDAEQPNMGEFLLEIGGVSDTLTNWGGFSLSWNEENKTFTFGKNLAVSENWEVATQTPAPINGSSENFVPSVVEFPLTNIDDVREDILQKSKTTAFKILSNSPAPYSWSSQTAVNDAGATPPNVQHSVQFSQEGLGLKTYQSDLFNNWIDTEWIDGVNGVNEVTSVDTTGDSFTIDALNLAKKVYVMLNRIAISGGTYDDWLDAVYSHDRMRSVEEPMYMGSLIKELAFQEVISTADAETSGQASTTTQPLGTLAGRGRLTNKDKGGKIKIKVDEPCQIMGIVSITPRIDYSQGNEWFIDLATMDDLHKPALDAIGFQDLITEQMAWQDTEINFSGVLTKRSAGKVPAWINYMTNVNKTYGNFADRNKEMFMTLNRRYDINQTTGRIDDLTTYIDPSKFNHIFAQTNLDAMNFWVQIGADVTARRKMSAKVIPNL